jgi:hypothetical protein
VINESLIIGADFPGGDEYFDGTIREARVYGRALSPPEIQDLVNLPPVLNPISDVGMVAGQTLAITNEASDPDFPVQSLTFSLLQGPAGATLDPGSGVFTWPSTLADAGSTNPVTIQVADDGVPSLSDTQSFEVTARLPVEPVLSTPANDADLISFDVSGDPGLDYGLWSSSNLWDWSLEFVTNPVLTPFQLNLPFTPADAKQFYRIQIE